MLLTSIYIVLTYVLTDQPMEWDRFIKFMAVGLMMAVISESLGLAISARLNIVVSIVFISIYIYLFMYIV